MNDINNIEKSKRRFKKKKKRKENKKIILIKNKDIKRIINTKRVLQLYLNK